MRYIAGALLAVRFPVLLTFGVLLGVSLWTLPRIDIDLSIAPLLEASESRRQKVLDFAESLPVIPASVVCAVQWPHPITAAELAELDQLGDRLRGRPDIRSVMSLATIRVIEKADPLPRAHSFMELARGESVDSLVSRHPLLQQKLISRDRRSAVLLIDRVGGRGTLEDFETFVEAHAPAEAKVHLLGPSFVDRAMRRTMVHDMIQSVALESLCFVILLSLLFRTLRGVVIPSAVILTALGLHFGLTYALGWSISIIEVAIPGLVMVICLCDAVHMMHRYEEARVEHGDCHRAILEMMDKIGMACLFTSLTTALGFLSLLVAPHAAVRDFAVSASIGIGIAFVCVITLLPLLLSLWPVRPRSRIRTVRISLPLYGRPGLTAMICVGIVAVSGIGVSRVVVDSHWLEELPGSAPEVRDLRWYEEHYGGLLNLEVRVDGDLGTPEAVRRCEALQERICREPGVRGVESYTQWIREMVGNPGRTDDLQLARGIGFLRLTGDLFPRHLITPKFDRGRIRFLTEDVGTRRFLELKALIEDQALSLGPGLDASVAGYGLMAHESSRLVVTTMMNSLLLSIAVITVFIVVIFRSFRIGLIAIVPNLLPILAALGLTGWLGSPLRIGIVMIYCVGIGLAVDDTIHMLNRWFRERRDHPDQPLREQLARTFHTTGTALVITSLVLTVGALCYLPSSLRSLRDVGILLTAVVTVALAADLYVLPHLVERFFGERDGSRVRTRPLGHKSGHRTWLL